MADAGVSNRRAGPTSLEDVMLEMETVEQQPKQRGKSRQSGFMLTVKEVRARHYAPQSWQRHSSARTPGRTSRPKARATALHRG